MKIDSRARLIPYHRARGPTQTNLPPINRPLNYIIQRASKSGRPGTTRLDLETSKTDRQTNLNWTLENQTRCVSVLAGLENEMGIYRFGKWERENKSWDNPSKLLHDWIIILLIQLNAIDNSPQHK